MYNLKEKIEKTAKITGGVLFLIALAIHIKVTLDDPFVMLSDKVIAQMTDSIPSRSTDSIPSRSRIRSSSSSSSSSNAPDATKFIQMTLECRKTRDCGEDGLLEGSKGEYTVCIPDPRGGPLSECHPKYCDGSEPPLCPSSPPII